MSEKTSQAPFSNLAPIVDEYYSTRRSSPNGRIVPNRGDGIPAIGRRDDANPRRRLVWVANESTRNRIEPVNMSPFELAFEGISNKRGGLSLAQASSRLSGTHYHEIAAMILDIRDLVPAEVRSFLRGLSPQASGQSGQSSSGGIRIPSLIVASRDQSQYDRDCLDLSIPTHAKGQPEVIGGLIAAKVFDAWLDPILLSSETVRSALLRTFERASSLAR